MEVPKLSDGERQILNDSEEIAKLKSMKGWYLALGYLESRAKSAEDRVWSNISTDPKVAFTLQLVARERRSDLEALKSYVDEVIHARKQILMEIFHVNEETLDAAEENALELRGQALNR